MVVPAVEAPEAVEVLSEARAAPPTPPAAPPPLETVAVIASPEKLCAPIDPPETDTSADSDPSTVTDGFAPPPMVTFLAAKMNTGRFVLTAEPLSVACAVPWFCPTFWAAWVETGVVVVPVLEHPTTTATAANTANVFMVTDSRLCRPDGRGRLR